MNRLSQIITLTQPSTASTTTYGAAFKAPEGALKIIVRTVAFAGGTNNVYLQESLDGVTWYDACAFPQNAIGVSANLIVPVPTVGATAYAVTAGTVSAAVPTLAANTYTAGPWGPFVRLVGKTGVGTTGADVLQIVSFVTST